VREREREDGCVGGREGGVKKVILAIMVIQRINNWGWGFAHFFSWIDNGDASDSHSTTTTVR
jgi:hypothetical protein